MRVRGLRAAAALLAVLLVALAAPPARAQVLSGFTAIENALPGDERWDARLPLIQSSHVIGGYASRVSVPPGATVDFHVRARRRGRYLVTIHRLGGYGGLGARLIGCVPSCTHDRATIAGPPLPAPDPASGELRAGWPVTDRFRLPLDAASGYYIAQFVLTSGADAGTRSWYPFIVTPPALPDAPMLVIVPVNTWQAYNAWGGRSLYAFNSRGGEPANVVSFDRPYAPGSADALFNYSYPLVRRLEDAGAYVDYATDVDIQRDPSLLTGRQLVMVLGHAEYWTRQMRDLLDAARAGAANLAFIGADLGFWQIRYANGERSLVEYRSAALDPIRDPRSKTIPFAELQPPRPTCALTGLGYRGALHETHSFTVTPEGAADPWLAGTGLSAGDQLPDAVAGEWDGLAPGCLTGVTPTVLLHYADRRGQSRDADAIRYTAPSGATVFSSGSLGLVERLAGPHPDRRIERLLLNASAALAPAAFTGAGLPARERPPLARLRPRLRHVRLAPRLIALGRAGRSAGAVLSFELSRPATVFVRLVRVGLGGVTRHCHCSVVSTVVARHAAGRGRIRLLAGARGARFAAGRYRAIVVAIDRHGVRSRRADVAFRIVLGP